MKLGAFPIVFSLLFSSAAFAQTDYCAGLSAESSAVAKDVMNSSYMYDCCDDTIAACLKEDKVCSLAKRLSNEVCRLAGLGKNAKDIKHSLEQRALSMSSLTPAVKIEMTPDHVWGNPQARVVLSVYLCARCPFCSRHVPALIDALEKSSLKDKVAVNLRLFPIKTHENSTQAALAVEAAARMGKGWEYLLNLYAQFDQFSLASIPELGEKSGLDAAQFAELQTKSDVRDAVVRAKKEGFVNNVEKTPTFFLNGRKIQGAFDVESVISMIEEAIENAG